MSGKTKPVKRPTREELADTLSRTWHASYDKLKPESETAGRQAWLAVAEVVLADLQRANALVLEVSRLRQRLKDATSILP